MKKHLRSVSLALLMVFISSFAYANVMSFNNLGTGINVNVIESRYGYTKIEYIFNGYDTQEMKINGVTYLTLSAPDLTWIMEKGNPQMLTHKGSLLIPDNSAMNYRIVSLETEEISTLPIAPSKGHFTRDIDPNSVPYTFGSVYNTDKYFPENLVSFDSPYIVRDFRGMVVQFNPLQYNPVKGTMKITKRLILEVYTDNSKPVINPFIRQFPLTKVSTDFSELYRFLFMNYGIGDVRFEPITEPGRMLVVYPAAYTTIAQQFVQWKQTRGLTVLTAEYPTQTGTGNAALKTYIQNLYNTPEKITYIVLIGESYDIPTLNGVYEAAPSDPCYVKLAGTDAYPDAFISRVSCQNATTMNYVIQKMIKFERDIQFGAGWYNKGTGIGGPDVGGSPPYADSIRMNWVRDTLMLGGFTQVDKCNGPAANATTLINFLNQGRYVLNYVGHGSGTSWSNTGFNTTNAYQLANGWMNPYLCDVACLNGNFTLSECLNEALLRAGDTANPKGISTGYASSTNASWVPPCDMQLYTNHLISRQFRKTAGAVSFFGVMYAMDKWGGSTGEGLKLMEQYNILGDCSLLLTRGVPLGPAITHNQLPNTENLTGPYVVNCIINVANAPLKPNSTKLFWSRNNTVMTDSLLMTNSSGNNWTGNIPGNGTASLYRYRIMTIDTMNRVAYAPGPTSVYSFNASPDVTNPVITHTPLPPVPKSTWPATVTASVTDNMGLDSVWVKWYKNNTGTGIKHFKLLNTTGSTFAALFNSTQADVNFGDYIHYRIFARDNSSNHNTDSTALCSFPIISLTNVCIGTGTTSSNYPFTTYWMDGRTQMLFTAAEINMSYGYCITRLGFNIISAASQVMNGFSVKFQHTTATSLSGFVSSGWSTAFTGTYTVPGTGWQYIDMTAPYFVYNGTGNLLVEVCFDNSAYTSYSTVNATSTPGMTWGYYTDNSSGCTMTGGSAQSNRPNTCFTMTPITGTGNFSMEIPKSYSLAQNYPNPFNPVTKINFALPKQGLVTLRVYDVLGREVSTLVNEVKQAGSYSVDFDASMLSSGVYFYRIESGSFTDIKRMVLIK